MVKLELDVRKIDPYDRLLAYVYLPNGQMFNETLVREGYAQVATFPPNVKYQERFLKAQTLPLLKPRLRYEFPERSGGSSVSLQCVQDPSAISCRDMFRRHVRVGQHLVYLWARDS